MVSLPLEPQMTSLPDVPWVTWSGDVIVIVQVGVVLGLTAEAPETAANRTEKKRPSEIVAVTIMALQAELRRMAVIIGFLISSPSGPSAQYFSTYRDRCLKSTKKGPFNIVESAGHPRAHLP